MDKKEVIKSYKGFCKDLTCRGFQYEIGKEYELPENEEVNVCYSGFHACESPLEVMCFYFLNKDCEIARFCEVEQSGDFSREYNGSTKVASSKIKIVRELSLDELIEIGTKWLEERATESDGEHDKCAQIGSSGRYAKIASSGNFAQIGSSGECARIASSGNSAQIGSSGHKAQIANSGKYAQIASNGNYANIGSNGDSAEIGSSGYFAKIASNGDYAQIGSSGECAQITSSGNFAQIGSSGGYAKIASNGDYAQISSSGEDCVVCCTGRNSAVKAKQGSWITLSEWVYSEEKERYILKCVKTEYVDGKRIKADTWYKLVDGEFVEVSNVISYN